MKKLIYYSIFILLSIDCSDLLGQTLFTNITLNANQAILLDHHTTIFNGFNSGQFYSATISGNPGPGMPMKGAMAMLIDYNRASYNFIPINNTKYFTPGTGTYKFAPFLVDWSDLNDNTGNINVNL